MNRLIAIIAIVLFAPMLHAQPWMKGRENQPVKLQDVIDEYKRNPSAFQEEDEEETREVAEHGAVGEKKNYHFDRWVWYMKQHTDQNGYIVSPMQTFQEWNTYLQKYRHQAAMSKGAGTVSNWTFQGPATTVSGYSGIGRIQTVAFHPTDSNTYWIGSGGGGAWKTTNDGATWTCMTDMLPVLGVSDIVYNPLNPQVIYLCTGDRDAGDSYSIGVLKSTDGGATWATTGLSWTVQQSRYANDLVINPYDTASLLLASSQGIYKSNNSGTTWNLVRTGSFKQIMYRPNDSMVAYAAGSTGGSWGIYRTANGGQSWTASINVAASARIALAVSGAAPNSVKAVVAASNSGLDGIYASTDTGKTFIKTYDGVGACNKNILNGSLTLSATTCDGQGWYDLAIAISPTDSNKILVGGVNTYMSSNGGLAWTRVTQWYFSSSTVKTVHADKHFLAFQPLRPKLLFEGNDGGVYKTADPASTSWSDLTNGLGITQFYRNAVSNNASFVLGGAQDNGTKRVNFTGNAVDQTGGDGMNCEIDYSNPSVYYTALQYGSISRTTNGGSNFTNISNNIPGQPEGDWITPFLIHPKNPLILIAGYDRVYRSPSRGTTWSAISPVFYAGHPITRLALSNSDSTTIYAIAYNHVRATYDGGATWGPVTVPYNGTMSDIIVDPKDNKHFYITFSGYGTQRVVEYDTVNDWRDISGTLPDIPVNCITQDTANGTKYIGTDVAVFYRDSVGSWQLYSNGLPAAEVRDLGINYTTDEIWAATYGRGMWKSPKRNPPVVSTGIFSAPLAMNVITVSPNPSEGGHFIISTTNAALIGRTAQVHLLDMSGRSAWSSNLSFDGSGRMEIATQGLARGTYIVNVTATNGFQARTKIVIL